MDTLTPCCSLIPDGYFEQTEIENVYFNQFYDCLQKQFTLAYSKDIFGKKDTQEAYYNTNKFHYLSIILQSAWEEYIAWEENFDGVPTADENNVEIAYLIDKYKFRCLIKTFYCMECNINAILKLFCHTIKPLAESVQEFCDTDNATVADLIADGTDVEWYLTPTGSSPLDPSTMLVDNTHYYASQTLNYCESTQRYDVLVEIFTHSEPPDHIDASDGDICLGQSITLTVVGGTLGSNSIIQWYLSTDPEDTCTEVIPYAQGPSIVVTPLESTTYYVFVNYVDPEPCGYATTCVFTTVVVNPIVVLEFEETDQDIVCVGSTFTYTVQAGLVDYGWDYNGQETDFTIESGGTATDNFVEITWDTVGNYTIHVMAVTPDGCTATDVILNVTVLEGPTADAGPDLYICPNLYGAYSIMGSTYTDGTPTWTIINGDGYFGDTHDVYTHKIHPLYFFGPNDTPGSDIDLLLTVSNGYCDDATDTMTIHIYDELDAGIITPTPVIVCYGTDAGTFTVSGFTSGAIVQQWQWAYESTGPNYYWYHNGGPDITFEPGILTASIVIRALLRIDGCTAAFSEMAIVEVPPPTPPVVNTPQGFCFPDTVASLLPSGAGYSWYDVPSGGSPLADGTALTEDYYYVSFTDSNGCESNRAMVSVFASNPDTPTGDANQSFCINDTHTIAQLIAYSPFTIRWYAAASGGSPLLGSTVLIDGTTYYADAYDRTCVSLTRFAITVTIMSAATIEDITTGSGCSCDPSFELTVSATDAVSYELTWDAPAPANGFLDVGWEPFSVPLTISLFSPDPGTYTGHLTVNSGVNGTGCSSDPYEFDVVIECCAEATITPDQEENTFLVCCDWDAFNIPYELPEGECAATDYAIDFDNDAELVGWVDVVKNALTGSPIVVSIPVEVPYGTYYADLIFYKDRSECILTIPITIIVSCPCFSFEEGFEEMTVPEGTTEIVWPFKNICSTADWVSFDVVWDPIGTPTIGSTSFSGSEFQIFLDASFVYDHETMEKITYNGVITVTDINGCTYSQNVTLIITDGEPA